MRDDERDLVMVVRTPDGRWFCSDDADGTDPGVQFGSAGEAPAAGTYRVWVGTFGDPSFGDMSIDGMEMDSAPVSVQVRAARAELAVSEADFGMDVEQPMFYDGTYAGTDLRPDDAAQTLRLSGGEARAAVQAGGALANPVSGTACSGFLSARPTFDVSATDGELLRIDATADDEDLVMVVRTPSGRWLCSDDAGTRDPAVETDEDGRHAVWVGTFSRRDGGAAATATVSSVGTRM